MYFMEYDKTKCCKLNSINFTTNFLVLFEQNIFSLIYGVIWALTKLMTAHSKVGEQKMQRASLVGGLHTNW